MKRSGQARLVFVFDINRNISPREGEPAGTLIIVLCLQFNRVSRKYTLMSVETVISRQQSRLRLHKSQKIHSHVLGKQQELTRKWVVSFLPTTADRFPFVGSVVELSSVPHLHWKGGCRTDPETSSVIYHFIRLCSQDSTTTTTCESTRLCQIWLCQLRSHKAPCWMRLDRNWDKRAVVMGWGRAGGRSASGPIATGHSAHKLTWAAIIRRSVGRDSLLVKAPDSWSKGW